MLQLNVHISYLSRMQTVEKKAMMTLTTQIQLHQTVRPPAVRMMRAGVSQHSRPHRAAMLTY